MSGSAAARPDGGRDVHGQEVGAFLGGGQGVSRGNKHDDERSLPAVGRQGGQGLGRGVQLGVLAGLGQDFLGPEKGNEQREKEESVLIALK